ncbi:hypothetical protein DFJ58DRAFT_848690 [Suillus subalutaceus]|uniref:uncharacterized protein n=1 Tax=Suillus subalutaceus TaxID=48586 RepID=UPI001B86719A|nr:uncharacterized protein DFJ58DRAFT_848690 [Suillus subalutaceus]KAG1829539.1 hypothetical protein DFJ58DRAFT_848690 [Suillus subalutaceus]
MAYRQILSCHYTTSKRVLGTGIFQLIPLEVARTQTLVVVATVLHKVGKYQGIRVLLYDHSGGVVSTRFDIYQQPDLFSQIIAVINFGNLECVRYDSTVSFTKLVSPPLSKNIREYRPIKNIPRRSSSADPAASISESLDELGSWDPSFDDDLKSVVSHDSDDDLESVVSDDSGSEERLTDSEDAPEGNSIESTTQTEEFPPSLPPVQPTMVSSAPLLSLASQIPQDLTESISSVTPHPSQFPYSVHSPEPCGKIRVGDDVYIIKRILSASRGLVGRGCICYLASLGDEDFIIKDHWVLGKREDVILNEIEMLKLMQGVPGVPELVDYWLVTTSEGEVDVTRSYRKRERRSTKGTSRTHVHLVLKPCARPLHMFRTLKEFVRALRDIVIIQRMAVEERGILHRDSRGSLLTGLRIAADNKYPIGGTGTIPFMSRMLLSQVSLFQQKNAPALKTPKTSSDSLALPVSHVVQGYSDDLESLFFIFAWVCIKFCGPNGTVRQEHMPNSLLDRWTSLDLALCAAFKITFFANPLDEQCLINEFHPYFKPLIPLAKDWCAALKDNMVNPVTFDAILHILNSHLEELSDDEELQSTVTMLKKTATALTSSLKCVASLSLPMPKRRKSDDLPETSEQV